MTFSIDSGWIVSTTNACTCGMGRYSEYGHEAFCGLEQEAPVEEFDAWVKHMLVRERAAALDAAMEAVAALDAYYAIEECQGSPLVKGDPNDPDPWQQGHLIQRDDTLAAIDALKEKP